MKPENANPKNFSVRKIIYITPDGFFSIANGTWEDDGSNRFAMRWNGDINNPNDKGYPSVFDNPMWFQLPIEIKDILNVLTECNKRIELAASIRKGIGNPPDLFK
jgi:hypothetical protein